MGNAPGELAAEADEMISAPKADGQVIRPGRGRPFPEPGRDQMAELFLFKEKIIMRVPAKKLIPPIPSQRYRDLLPEQV